MKTEPVSKIAQTGSTQTPIIIESAPPIAVSTFLLKTRPINASKTVSQAFQIPDLLNVLEFVPLAISGTTKNAMKNVQLSFPQFSLMTPQIFVFKTVLQASMETT